ncbi:hypothetical protein HOI26_04485 [Candidatus Woesearchaeota archaeon]|nr:hypothetical protein [Candidatus Woesearchaeota archaeon]MBT5740327.1 hypothetical protein [Candidatus Woesearchaeota archaeon]
MVILFERYTNEANKIITPTIPNSSPLNGKVVRKPPIPITPNNPKAQDGQAGAIRPTNIPVPPALNPPLSCLLTKKMLMDNTILPKKATIDKNIRETGSIALNNPTVNFNQSVIEKTENSSL